MKIVALTRKEWLSMLLLGNWLPAALVAMVAVLAGSAIASALALGLFLHGVMLFADAWWCVSMGTDTIFFRLFASFVSRIFLGALVMYIAFKSELMVLPMFIGYVISMGYCMYRRTLVKGNEIQGKLCHNN